MRRPKRNRVPFALFGGSDNHNPNDVIAQIVASGLAMPDRDYYVKKEPRFVEARKPGSAMVRPPEKRCEVW